MNKRDLFGSISFNRRGICWSTPVDQIGAGGAGAPPPPTVVPLIPSATPPPSIPGQQLQSGQPGQQAVVDPIAALWKDIPAEVVKASRETIGEFFAGKAS